MAHQEEAPIDEKPTTSRTLNLSARLHGRIFNSLLDRVADEILHAVTPVLYVTAWLLLVPKGALRWRDVPRWMIFPLVYGLYSLAHGALSGFYPYFFMDVGKVGYTCTLSRLGGLALALVALGFVAVGIDRAMGRPTHQH
jgi:hypothetical protein